MDPLIGPVRQNLDQVQKSKSAGATRAMDGTF
jgi:hypothetical protein